MQLIFSSQVVPGTTANDAISFLISLTDSSRNIYLLPQMKLILSWVRAVGISIGVY